MIALEVGRDCSYRWWVHLFYRVNVAPMAMREGVFVSRIMCVTTSVLVRVPVHVRVRV